MTSRARTLIRAGAIGLAGTVALTAASSAWARPGDLDPGFAGGAGEVRTLVSSEDIRFSGWRTLTDIAIQPDGKVVVVTSGTEDGWSNLVVARYTPSGSLDSTFGGPEMGGAQPGLVSTWFADDEHAYGSAVAVQPDGKIVAAGLSYVDWSGGRQNIAVARYRGDGSLDPRFGEGGLVRIEVPDAARPFGVNDLAIQDDGRIIVLGSVRYTASDSDIALTRLMPDGSLDTSFSPDGFISVDVNRRRSTDRPEAMVLQSDGKIVVVGWAQGRETRDFLAARFNADGSLDATFGGGLGGPGIAVFDIRDADDYAYAVALAPDGKIVVAGRAWHETPAFGRADHDDIAVARLDQSGRLDPTFAGRGWTTWDAARRYEEASAVAVQADGKILVAGHAMDRDFRLRSGLLGRINADGTADASFGDRGIARVDGLSWFTRWGLAVQNDRIVTAVRVDRDVVVWQRVGAGDVKNLLNDDRLFLAQQARDFLGREATAAELDEGLEEFSPNGSFDRGEALAGMSGNSKAVQLIRWHLLALFEMPRYGRYKRLLDEYRDGRRTALQIARAITRSAGFRARWGGLSNHDFVRGIFVNAKGREPRPSEIASLVASLDRGQKSRADVLLWYGGDPDYRRSVDTLARLVHIFASTLHEMRPVSELAAAAVLIDAGVGSLASAVGYIPDLLAYRGRFFNP